MKPTIPTIQARKRIALVAHDNKKNDLLEWARYNRETLSRHHLFGTGTTGRLLEKELDLPLTPFQKRPDRRRPANRRKNCRRRD